MVPHFPTVVHYAIALAIYMGIKEIYLLGCDCTGFITIAQSQLCTNNYDFQYGYSISENEKRRMLRTNSIHSIEEELVAHAEIFKIYKILYKYCNKNKIKLVNCTDGGLLNGIERNSLSNIL